MKLIKKKAIKALKSFGCYRMEDLPAVDFRSFRLNLCLLSDALGQQSFLVEVPTSRLRAFDFIGFSLDRGGKHPFVLMAEDMLAGTAQSFTGSVLESYYDRVQPQRFTDVLFDRAGLKLASDAFDGLTSLEASLPWVRNDPKKVRKSRLREMQKEALNYGKNGKEYLCWPFIGPVSRERGELEFQRLREFLDSVAAHGYKPGEHEGHVSGYLLTFGEASVVVISGGQHRAACLTALGHDTIPVVIRNYQRIDRSNADHWCGVKDGFVTQAQALNIFDRVFEGRLPRYFEERW